MVSSDRLALTFLGAAQTVTGSMHLLDSGPTRLLVDCGLYQGRRHEANRRNRHLSRAAVGANAVLLTHAHIDHSGNLPSLVKAGFAGPIHCTEATADLCQAMLRDSARIQQSDARWLNRKNQDNPDWEPIEPLYTEEDVETTLARFVPHAYDKPVALTPEVSATFIDAGHVLGSASILVDLRHHGQRRRIAFSGDIGRINLPILRDPVTPEAPDYVVMESTYGDRTHAPGEEMQGQLLEAIERTRARGGKVLIPSFALERAQEIVFSLNQLMRSGRLAPLPVYVDSPLTVNLTEVFRNHPECYDTEASFFHENHGDPFGFDRLTMISSVQESKQLNSLPGPMIVISASGMCESGRIVHHLRNTIEDPKNMVVIVGFQAQHTLGRRLVERRPQVRIFGVYRDLNCEVRVLDAFSAHADRDDLLSWAQACGPQVRRFFLVHGELDQATALRRYLAEQEQKAEVPSEGERTDLRAL